MQLDSVREKQLNVRLTPEEDARFTRVASHFGLSPAALVRMLVIQKARELGLEPSSPLPAQPRTKTKTAPKKR